MFLYKVPFGLALLLFLSQAFSEQRINFDPVHVQTKYGGSGNGARFQTGDGCITVTAEHVIAGTANPVITPLKSAVDMPFVEKKDSQRYDVAIIRQRHKEKSDCPRFPTNSVIEAAIRSGKNRTVWFTEASGTGLIYNVDLKKVSHDFLELQLRADEIDNGVRVRQGLSGSLVVFDGIPIAIVQKADTTRNRLTALRLDVIRRQYPEIVKFPILTSSNSDPTPKLNIKEPIAKIEPYDISQLPEIFQTVVKESRTNRKLAEKAAAEASVVKQRAEHAANYARRFPRTEYNNGFAHFLARNGNDHAGEVVLERNTIYSAGFGVSVAGGKTNTGDTYYCRFVRGEGCHGNGVLEYAVNEGNSNNLSAWWGSFSSGKRHGYGHLTWVCASDQSSKQSWFFDGEIRSGVWEKCNGYRYEGTISTSWHGLGVLWKPDGNIHTLGRWDDGKLKESFLYEWQRTGQIDTGANSVKFRQALTLSSSKYDKSSKIYKSLCKKKHVLSCYIIGYRYANGQGVPQDYQKAHRAYEFACDNNDSHACTNLGLLYRDGHGVNKDLYQAYQISVKACDLEQWSACENAADLVIDQDFSLQQTTSPQSLLRKACLGGRQSSCEKLSNI